MKKTIGITNDDGYTQGAKILLEFAKELGNAYAVLPHRQRSAVSAAVTLHKPLRLQELHEDIYTLSGTPADCSVFMIYAKELPTPDIVLSGINWGDNTGMSPLISSGTIGACWKAAIHGKHAVAFSFYRRERMGWQNPESWGDPEVWKKALRRVWKKIAPMVGKYDFLVVNFPAYGRLESAKIVFGKDVQMKRTAPVIEKRADPHGEPYFWLGGESAKMEKGSDFYEVREKGNIVITRISMKKMVR